MEPRNDLIYGTNNRLQTPSSVYGVPGYLGNQLMRQSAEVQQYTTQRSRPLRVNNVKKNARIKIPKRKQTQIRRQFIRPGTGLAQRPQQQQPVARNAFQMSILLLSLLAFGTFATTSIMMRNRRSNRRDQSGYRIIIDKKPGMEEESNSTNTSNTSFTYWTSALPENFFEFVTDFVQDVWKCDWSEFQCRSSIT